MNVCDVAPTQGTLGVPSAQLLVPGDPSTSIVSLRIRTLASGRMPPLASHVVDSDGVALIDQWIGGLSACPP
jgi:hypothetical protein